MRGSCALLLAATLLAPLSALAVEDPNPGKQDSRVRVTAYDPMQIVRLVSTDLMPLQVIFDEGEKPVMIAGSHVVSDPAKADSEGWFAKPSGNMLLLMPTKPIEMTMLFLRTVTADGKDRHYTFELRDRKSATTDGVDPSTYVSVQFTYKAVPDPDALAAAQARHRAEQEVATQRAVATSLYRAANTGMRNTDYLKRDPVGCPVLAPTYAFDDGVRTSLVFAPNTTLPEVYVINQDGKEAITTPIAAVSSMGLQIDIPGIFQELRLRRGGKVCAIRNAAYNPVGVQPGGGTGTISPDVVRTVRQ